MRGRGKEEGKGGLMEGALVRRGETWRRRTKLDAKRYRKGILMYGKKISYKEVAKWFKYKY